MRFPLLYIIACLSAAAVPLLPKGCGRRGNTGDFPRWPTRFEGRPLKRLPLADFENRFAEGFPGRMARFTDGEREIVIRWVTEETRKLHPAARCFRSFGYSVQPLPLRRDRGGNEWGCFLARRAGERLRVSTRIHDGEGNGWTDESAWYWAAILGRTRGPWWAFTVAKRHRESEE